MIETIDDLPAGVSGVCASGEFTVEEFQTVVVPEVDRLVADGADPRLVLQLSPEFTGFGEGAWGELTDNILRMPFRRAAVVTDDGTVSTALNLMKWLLRGDVRTFRNDEYDAAVAWVAG